MECEGCGISPSDLPLEQEDAESFFYCVEGNYYCDGCNEIRLSAFELEYGYDDPEEADYLDFGDGNGYDYDDEDDR